MTSGNAHVPRQGVISEVLAQGRDGFAKFYLSSILSWTTRRILKVLVGITTVTAAEE